MSFILNTAIHLIFIGLIYYGLSLYELDPSFVVAIRRHFGGQYRFLTMIACAGTVMLLAVSLLSCIARPIHRLTRFLTILLLPLNSFISLFYWSVKGFDPTLIYSKSMTSRGFFYPVLSDICVHVVPALASMYVFYFRVTDVQFQLSFGMLLILLNGAYITWACYVYSKSGVWTYPILEKLSPREQFMFLMFTSLATVGIYAVHCWLHQRLTIRQPLKEKRS